MVVSLIICYEIPKLIIYDTPVHSKWNNGNNTMCYL